MDDSYCATAAPAEASPQRETCHHRQDNNFRYRPDTDLRAGIVDLDSDSQ